MRKIGGVPGRFCDGFLPLVFCRVARAAELNAIGVLFDRKIGSGA